MRSSFDFIPIANLSSNTSGLFSWQRGQLEKPCWMLTPRQMSRWELASWRLPVDVNLDLRSYQVNNSSATWLVLTHAQISGIGASQASQVEKECASIRWQWTVPNSGLIIGWLVSRSVHALISRVVARACKVICWLKSLWWKADRMPEQIHWSGGW